MAFLFKVKVLLALFAVVFLSVASPISALAIIPPTASLSALPPKKSSISIVTGASGFVGRHVIYSLLSRQKALSLDKTQQPDPEKEIIICLVRPNRIQYEQTYWDAHLEDLSEFGADENICVKVMPYDMVDGGATLYNALQSGYDFIGANGQTKESGSCDVCVYHIASVFGPTADPIQTAEDNVQSAEDTVKAMDKFRHDVFQKNSDAMPNTRLVLTSSMAAVRATNQDPLNGKYYTNKDWNTLSKLDEKNWGSCYQWSKAESEKKAWDMVKECNLRWENAGKKKGKLEMVALCPSFVFGPPPPLPSSLKNDATARENSSSSYSLTLVNQWLRGKSEVQSRLCADVRDVAQAHIAAATIKMPDEGSDPTEMRYILSTEERLSSKLVAEALKRAVRRVQEQKNGSIDDFDMENISCDTKFDGGAIKIGEREVEATERLGDDLGVVCRSVEETFQDMAEALLSGKSF